MRYPSDKQGSLIILFSAALLLLGTNPSGVAAGAAGAASACAAPAELNGAAAIVQTIQFRPETKFKDITTQVFARNGAGHVRYHGLWIIIRIS